MMQEEIRGVPREVIIANYVRAHLEECPACLNWQAQEGNHKIPIIACINREPFMQAIGAGLKELIPAVNQALEQRPTYQQLLALVRAYYFTNGGNHFWEDKEALDERAQTILEKLGESTNREEEGA